MIRARFAQRLVAGVLLCSTYAVLAEGALAANGDLSFVSCITTNATTTGCTNISSTANALPFARQIVVSADGKHAYVGAANDVVSHFNRDPATGALTFSDCVTDNAAVGCTDIVPSSPLNQLSGIGISPDGRNLYVLSDGFDSIARFNLDATSGALAFADCLTVNAITTGCIDISAMTNSLDGARSVIVGPEGKAVYVTSGQRDAVVRFTRFLGGGLGFVGCVTAGDVPASGCGAGNVSATTNSLNSAAGLGISPDGTSVYATSTGADAVAHLTRDPATGAIAFADCVTAGDTPATGCGAGNISGTSDALRAPVDVKVTPNGSNAYVTGAERDAVVQFARNQSTGQLGFAGCLTAGDIPAAGCTNLSPTTSALNSPISLAIPPDASNVYATAIGSEAVTNLARDPASGTLSFASCLWDGTATTPAVGCNPTAASTNSFDLPSSLAMGPEGTTIYMTTSNKSSVIQLHRQLVPACDAVARQVAGGAATAVPITCSDANGEPLTRSIVAGPAHGKLSAIDQTGASVTYTPTPKYKGQDSFNFKANDGHDDSAAAVATLSVSPDVTRPVISRVRARPRAFTAQAGALDLAKRRKKGTKFSYRVSEPARVSFTIERPTVGRKVGRKCRRRTNANRGKRACTLYRRVGSFSQSGATGRNSKKFSGKLRSRALRAGRYRAMLRATDPAGNRSKRKSVRFRVIR